MSVTRQSAPMSVLHPAGRRPHIAHSSRALIIDENLHPLYETVQRRNPGETEFHQAVRGVLQTVGPARGRHDAVPNACH